MVDLRPGVLVLINPTSLHRLDFALAALLHALWMCAQSLFGSERFAVLGWLLDI